MRWRTWAVPQHRGLECHGGWLRVRSVAVEVVRGPHRGVAWSEVGAVATEHVDPLGSRLIEVSATRWAVLS